MIRDIMLKNAGADPAARRVAALRELFPECFGGDGSLDLRLLQEAVGGPAATRDDGYSLRFLGRDYANLLASIDTETVIQPDEEHNALPENRDSQNIYISGDNLDALKHLLKSYAGQVKCIYIDPPYNTGTDGFVYTDRFNFTPAQLVQRLGITEDEARRTLSMTSSHSASHSAWLAFMSPRLQLARYLLSPDGVIFISIDDNEQANLRLLCDYVFGEDNFLANIVWKHTQQSKNDERFFSRHHNEILVYARNSEVLSNFRFDRSDSDNTNYSNPDNDPKGPWRSGDVRSPNYRKTLCFDIIAPNGNVINPPTNGWRWSKESIEQKISTGEIIFNKANTGIIRKIYLSEQKGRTPENLWEGDMYGTTRQASAEIKALFDGVQVFDTPKPTQLIKRIITLTTTNGDIVVDFFSGSGTTADAVMQLNAESPNQDSSCRKYILVQMQEECSKSSDAYKAGFRTIDEIGMERIKRAAKKIREEHPGTKADLGFRHYTLRDVPQNVLDRMETFSPNEPSFADNLLETFGLGTVLATWMERDGYGLAARPELTLLAGYAAYTCGDHLYLLHAGMTDDAVTALVDRYAEPTAWNPHNIVVFGYNFGFGQMDALRTNIPLLAYGEKQVRINIDVRY